VSGDATRGADANAATPPEYPFTFTCLRSGNCCAVPGGVVRVTEVEIAGIAAHLQLSVAAVRSRYVAPSGDRLRDGLATRCVFLQEGRGGAACAIYPARPARCRSWPFWPELLTTPQALRDAMRRCPGITLRPAVAP
jgi:hypothetical protein